MNKENAYFLSQTVAIAENFNSWLSTYRGEFQNEKSRFCEVYDLFTEGISPDKYEGHNCIACNLEEGAYYLNTFLSTNKECAKVDYYVTMLTTIMYLETERIAEIYKELGLSLNNGKFDWGAFPNLQRIKYWANFFKHPKAYMYLHHPKYHIISDPNKPNFMIEGIIDDQFVKKFYSGEKHNQDLKELLRNKDGYKVFFPDLVEFIESFCKELENLIRTISAEPNHVETLKSYTLREFNP